MNPLGPALLFCPADRPERFDKAAVAADGVILDLEDAVGPEAKELARRHMMESALDPATTVVRVNPTSSDLFSSDLDALRKSPYTKVMVPKAESAADLAALEGFSVIAICESPLGIRHAEDLADAKNVIALTWGAEDLVAGIGGRSSRFADGGFRQMALYARSRVLIAAAGSGKYAYDTVYLDIPDEQGLQAEAADAAASGFVGALCIHPNQVAVIRDAFRPSDETVRWAREVIAAAAVSPNGVFAFGGRMIDEPILRQARRIRAAK